MTLQKNSIFLITAIFFNTLVFSFSEDKILSIHDYLTEAIKNDQVKQLILQERSLTANYELAKTLDNWMFSIGAGNTIILSQGNILKPSLSVSATKLYPGTGTDFSVSYARSFSTTSTKDQNKISLGISQPLIQNHFGYQKLLYENKLIQSRELSRLQIVESYEQYYMEIMTLYYDWYLSYLEKEFAIQMYNDYDLLYQDIVKRKKNHIARDIDVNKVRVQLLEKRENLISQKNIFKSYTDRIIKILNLSLDNSFIPALPEEFALDLTQEESSLLIKSRTETALKLEVLISSLNVKMETDNLNLPLDFSAIYELTNYPDGSSSDQSTFYSGVTLPFPFFTTQEEASAKLAGQAYQQLLLSQQEKRRDFSNNLNQTQSSINDEKAYLDIYRRKVEYLKSIAEDEKENYLRGQASLNELIQSMSNFETARKKIAYHQVQLEKQKIEWLALTDQLVK